MANPEESSPLLKNPDLQEKSSVPEPTKAAMAPPPSFAVSKVPAADWTAEGLPLSNGSVVGEPVRREQWDSSIFACLGRNDEFCSSDLEVCLLGSVVPCVLYGSNVERLGAGPGSFARSCFPYTGLYMLGNSILGGNCIAPWFSYPSRTAIRRKFNLEGTCEAAARSFGCCSGILEDEVKREQMESACDFATHFFCHPCSLCQEGRELRRRLPHPGFNSRSLAVMMPPTEQRMGRGSM